MAVRIVVGNRPPADAELFLSGAPRDRSQLVEDVCDMLDGGDAFVPVRCGDGGGIRLVGKHAIAWVAIRHRDPDAAPEEPAEVFELYDRRHRVELALANDTVRGFVLDSSPADRPRVIDHLNRVERFVRLWTPDEQLLVNRAMILEVVELPEES